MNKTDNLELMARPADTGPEQLTLPLPVKSEPPLSELQKKQKANHEAVCAELRREAALFFSIVQARYPDAGYTNLREVTITHLKECRAEFEAHPEYNPRPATVPYPELSIDYVAQAKELFSDRPEFKPKVQRDYQPWSWQRRTQTAVRNLRGRFLKRFSIGELWIDQAQAKILENPWRYGCCPLPSEGSCIIPNPAQILAKQAAIAVEIKERNKL